MLCYVIFSYYVQRLYVSTDSLSGSSVYFLILFNSNMRWDPQEGDRFSRWIKIFIFLMNSLDYIRFLEVSVPKSLSSFRLGKGDSLGRRDALNRRRLQGPR